MTRDEALLKLLAIEPETKDHLIQITGWPVEETVEVLNRLVLQKRVGYGSCWQTSGRRLYYPKEQARA